MARYSLGLVRISQNLCRWSHLTVDELNTDGGFRLMTNVKKQQQPNSPKRSNQLKTGLSGLFINNLDPDSLLILLVNLFLKLFVFLRFGQYVKLPGKTLCCKILWQAIAYATSSRSKRQNRGHGWILYFYILFSYAQKKRMTWCMANTYFKLLVKST